MKSIFTLIVFSLGTLSCSSSTDSDRNTSFEKNECVSAGAAYYVSMTELDGNCGPMTDQVMIIPEDGNITTEGLDCDSKPKYNSCEVFTNMSCHGFVNGYLFNLNQSGKIVWAKDGSEGSGVVTIMISAGGESCVSTYEYEATIM